MNVHRCLIVPSAYQVLAQSLCAGLAGEAGAGMLTTGISATGNTPATHYIAAGKIKQEFAALMDDAAALYQACVAAGIAVTQQQCADILSASDISTDQPFDAMARLNLQLIRG